MRGPRAAVLPLPRAAAMRGTATIALLLAAAAALVAGCGAQGRTNKDRPPPVIELNAVVSPAQVKLSPVKVGGGPLVIVISNQTQSAQSVRMVGDRISQRIARVDPGDTTRYKADLAPGTYTLAAGGGSVIRAAELEVGPERDTAQNDVLLP